MISQNEVYIKVKELGQALRESEQYLAMRAAVDKVNAQPELSMKLEIYSKMDDDIEAEMQKENPNMATVADLSEELEVMGESLKAYGDILDMMEAKEAFSKLVYQVNTMLQFIVTGIKPQQSCPPSGCADCSVCSVELY